MRRISTMMALVGAMTLTGATAASAQAFGGSSMDIGPVIGFGGLGGAGMSFGGRFEKGIKQLPNMGNGALSFQLSIDYYSFNNRFLGSDFGFKYIPISGTINYHINTKSTKWDAFVGAGLGYLNFSSDYDGPGDFSSGGIYFVGRLGGRYYLANGMALYADVGAGAASLNVGLMFKLKK
ncbi:MAG: hypothetical protein HOP28_18165 [Gemmatimonadales bacterium]|nr:hypothetical protein [Gemmatimonadales bacterium]